jgi:hypothetical protein
MLMSLEFEITELMPASPDAIYNALLNSEKHSKMTGSPARVSIKAGDACTL